MRTRNCGMLVFYCRGMNHIDLVPVKVEHITEPHLYNGLSESDKSLTIEVVPELREIPNCYLVGKNRKSISSLPVVMDERVSTSEQFSMILT